ncbi:MAG: hypothetical protein KGJ57_19035 [Sphingomonadales bacterium]|nr:hypothetical protein [Sphingomonadales bacterium]MDE2171492.1 hypothetical protein [Sphingomonadales bacterium]
MVSPISGEVWSEVVEVAKLDYGADAVLALAFAACIRTANDIDGHSWAAATMIASSRTSRLPAPEKFPTIE